MSLFRGQRIKALSFSLSVFFLVSTSSSGEEFSSQVPVGHGFWGPQGGGQNASSKVISLAPAKRKNSKTVYIKVTIPINNIDSEMDQPVIDCMIIAVAKNLTPSARTLVIKNVTEANF